MLIFPSTNNVGGGKYLSESVLTTSLDSVLGSRIISGMTFSLVSGLTYAIAAGKAWVKGYYLEYDGGNVTVAPNSTTYIVLRIAKDASQKITSISLANVTTPSATTDFAIYKSVAGAGSATITAEAVRYDLNTDRVLSGTQSLTQEITGLKNVLAGIKGIAWDATPVNTMLALNTAVTDISSIKTQIKALSGAVNWNDSPAATLAALNTTDGNTATSITNIQNQIKAVTGGAQWNSTPANTIAALNSTLTTAGNSITSIQTQIRAITGGALWDSAPATTIAALSTGKVDTSAVSDVAGAAKIPRADANGKLAYDITGTAANATSAAQATYATKVGNATTNYSLDQNLRQTDSPSFLAVTVGSNIKLEKNGANSRARLTTASGFEVYSGSANLFTCDNSGNVTALGTVTGSKVYNPAFNDLAEWFPKESPSEYLPAGTVVEKVPGKELYRRLESPTAMAIGVTTKGYAFIMGGEKKKDMEDNAGKYHAIALAGRVPVRVTGPVAEGDELVPAGAGLARSNSNLEGRRTVLGRALTASTKTGEGVVLMLVRG